MKLTHWSKEPLVIDPKFKYPKDRHFKPNGLWFDVDEDWKRWCESEGFRPECLAVQNRIELNHDGILHLKTGTDIDRFTDEYGAETDGRYPRIEIHWQKVRDDFKGIIIAPYCWGRRMADHTFWYYSWDCASGCVWDLTRIMAVIPSTQAVTERRSHA